MASEAAFRAGYERWLGIPWTLNGESLSGCDCWGLVKLVYAHELELELKHPSEMSGVDALASARRVAEVRELVLGEIRFRPVNWEDELQDLDVLELTLSGGRADHVGLAAGGMLLHSRRNIGSHRVAFENCPQILGAWRLA